MHFFMPILILESPHVQYISQQSVLGNIICIRSDIQFPSSDIDSPQAGAPDNVCSLQDILQCDLILPSKELQFAIERQLDELPCAAPLLAKINEHKLALSYLLKHKFISGCVIVTMRFALIRRPLAETKRRKLENHLEMFACEHQLTVSFCVFDNGAGSMY